MSFGKFRKESSPGIFRKAKFGVDKFILVQRFKIHYIEAGAGEPVILVPGSYTANRALNSLMPLLAAEYRILALDYRGTGDSDKTDKGPDETVQEQTDLIAKMVQQMGLDKVNLIGGSYGGAVVFDFAARYPEIVSKIVSIEGGVIKPDKIKGGPSEYTFKMPLIGNLSVQVARTGSNKPAAKVIVGSWYSSETSIEKKNPPSKNSPNEGKSGILGYQINIARKNSQNIEETAKFIKSPVLYLYGTESDQQRILLNKNIEYLKSFLPHAWIVALEGGIHDLAIRQPGEVSNMILEFLRKRPTSKN